MTHAILTALLPFVVVAFGVAIVRIWTIVSYYQALRQFNDSPHGGPQVVQSPQIPYWLPWLGNTTSFLTTTPGSYWKWLFAWHPRSTGVLTLLIGGRRTHILFSPTAVQALFKARSPARDIFEQELYGKVFEMTPDQIHNAHAGKQSEAEMNGQYLVNFSRVNELTAHFTKVLDEVLSKDAQQITQLDSIGLYDWLRDRMFTASTTALMGEKLLEMYPEFCQDFFAFDRDFLSFFFGIPDFVIQDAIKRKRRIKSKLEQWSLEMHRLSGGAPIDPEGPAWEPYFGARLNRARQIDYKRRNLNTDSAAALDLGIVFGLSSNVIPATGWMLMHILDPDAPSTLLPRVLREIRASTNDDGTLNIPTLVQQSLLQSIWTETLRLYVDVLVTRNCSEDITLPLDEDRKRHVLFKQGDNLFAPAAIGHFDPKSWTSEASHAHKWDADRFLTRELSSGQESFSAGKTTGKFFPFGGGKTICPGRFFAKQEALGALAMILSKFDIEVMGFIDADKKPRESFPGPASAFPGSGALAPGDDMLVKIRGKP